MRWYGEEGFEEISVRYHLGFEEVLVADSVVHALEALAFFGTAADEESVVELVAGELDLLAMVVVLDEPDEMAG